VIAGVVYWATLFVLRFTGRAHPSALWLLAPAGVALLAFAIAYVAHRPRRFALAAAIDRRCGLQETAATAVHASDAPAADMPAEWRSALAAQADRRAGALHPDAVRQAFALPKPWAYAVVTALLLIGHFASPLLPLFGAPSAPSDPQAAVQKAQDARQVREAARRLEARAKEIARAAELQKLERAHAAAQKVAQEARKLSQDAKGKKESMAELAKIGELVQESRREAAGKEGQGESEAEEARQAAFKAPVEDVLSELARELDEADAGDLDVDLDELADALKTEAAASRADGHHPRLDSRKLEDLMKRLKSAKEALDRLEQAMEDSPELRDQLETLTQKQREMLDRIAKKLESFAGS
jgi:hypothetical protein